MNCLSVNIYRTGTYDCTNRGVTSKKSSAYVLNVPGPFEPGPEDVKLRIVPGNVPGLIKAVPCNENGTPMNGPWMFGGNFIYSSDARFRESGADYPVPVHDRTE